jgi:hypothetical protein
VARGLPVADYVCLWYGFPLGLEQNVHSTTVMHLVIIAVNILLNQWILKVKMY